MKMSYLLLLIFICFFRSIPCRPTGIEENSDLEETEYNNDAVVEEANPEEDQTALEEQEQTDQEKLHQRLMAEDQFHDQLAENNPQLHERSENDVLKKMDSIESRERSFSRRQPLDENKQNYEFHEQRKEQNLDSNNENIFFTRNKKQNIRNMYEDSENYVQSNEDSGQDRYLNHYYEDVHPNNNRISNSRQDFDLSGFNYRDVRSVKEENVSDPTKENLNANENCKEDEQTIIKEHIKKLSEDDLKELLSSLTDDKKELLQKLIDDNSTSDNIIKREVTKINIEDDNLQTCKQTESDKNLGLSNKLENVETSSENTATAKNNDDFKYNEKSSAVETSDSLGFTATDSDKQSDLFRITDKNLKTDNRPVINNKDNGDAEFLQKSEINDYEEGLDSLQNNKGYKREIQAGDDEIALSLQSLEDSFPNSNNDENPLQYSEPLIRVKRKDSDKALKKRAAGVLPDSKAGYFSYKAENRDEDTNEGNEFDDEGFFDSLDSVNNNERQEYSDLKDNSNNCNKIAKSYDPIKENNSNFDVQKEAESVGSDTDLTISGIETIDDKLMYNSNSRDRRQLLEQADKHEKSKLMIDDDKIESTSEKYMNSPGYHEDDAFGPLPHNSIGDLGRYKRIRRVKQSHKDENMICNV